MPVDNRLYDTAADSWWDESGVLHALRGLNPARFGYMRRILTGELRVDLQGKRTLDVGCGGGLLAEEFARLGCAVTGIDPSGKSLESARAHARQEGLAIEYRQGVGEALPFPDGAFEIVYCCDALEHVEDLGRVIGEIARVLKPGGTFLYDTINRTLESWVVMIKLFQEVGFNEPDAPEPPRLEPVHQAGRAALEAGRERSRESGPDRLEIQGEPPPGDPHLAGEEAGGDQLPRSPPPPRPPREPGHGCVLRGVCRPFFVRLSPLLFLFALPSSGLPLSSSAAGEASFGSPLSSFKVPLSYLRRTKRGESRPKLLRRRAKRGEQRMKLRRQPTKRGNGRPRRGGRPELTSSGTAAIVEMLRAPSRLKES